VWEKIADAEEAIAAIEIGELSREEKARLLEIVRGARQRLDRKEWEILSAILEAE